MQSDWREISDPDLPQEPLGPERRRKLGMQDFDRDLATVPEVLGEVHGGHPRAPELALDDVAVGQSGLETIYDFGQVDSPARSYAPRLAPRFLWGQGTGKC